MLMRRTLALTLLALSTWSGAGTLLHAEDKKTEAKKAEEKPDVATLAHIKLSGALDETPVSVDPLFGSSQENFKSKLDRIKKAKDDAKVQGLYLQMDGVAIGRGKLHELRHAIADFRKSGKKAYAYMEAGSTADYLVALACDEVCLPESGWLMLTGMRAEVSFYKDLFEKLGIKADMLQMGNFKGAAEPYTRSSMSPEFRKQFESVIDDFYEKDLVAIIAQSRKDLSPEKVKKLIDDGPYTAKGAKAAGLVDRIAYADAYRNELKDTLKVERVRILKNYAKAKIEDIDLSNPFAIFKLLAPPKTITSTKQKVAVIYATGVIVTGKGGESIFGESACGSTTMVEAIRQAEQDDTVKAIVLRVDSPGGSALASDLIWNELTKCKKPVIASMSDVAASGGYYISMAAGKIYAEPGTLTGSIGVVGGKLALGGLYDKIGINTEIISRGANANLFSSTTPFSDSERKAMTALMKDVYDQFLDKAIQGRVKAGKKFTREDFTKYAEGRIWTGRQAKQHGLIDELGTLDDAITAARGLAKMDKDFELLVLPKSKTFVETLLESKGDARIPGFDLKQTALFRALPKLSGHLPLLEGMLHLRGEPVWAILPCRLEIK